MKRVARPDNSLFDEMIEQVGLFISVASGFIVAHAWNKLFETWFANKTKNDNDSQLLKNQLRYSILITVLVLLFSTLWIYVVYRKIVHRKK